MNIFTGKRIHIYNRKELPITEKIIEKVEKLAGDEGREIMGHGHPLFEWDPGIEINETMENNKEENITFGEGIPIQPEENL